MARASRAGTRRSRRVADDEEDSENASSIDPTQAVTQDEEMGDQSAGGDQEEEEEGAEDEDEEQFQTFDPRTFKDQPLIPQVAADKLNGFIQDWSSLDKKITETFPLLIYAAGIIEETRDDNNNKTINKLEKAVRDLIDTQRELGVHRDVLDTLRKQVGSQKNLDDAEEQYEKALKGELNKYRSQTSRQKYAKDKQFYKFRESVWEAKHSEAMPPVRGQIPAEEGDDDSDDDDLEIGGATVSYVCPISLKPFENPITSKVCGHSYSRDSLKDFISSNRHGANCPAAGCKKSVSLADCYNDTELARKQKIAMRRQKQREKENAEAEDMDIVE